MRLAETSAPPKPLSRGSAGAQGARPRRHAARHETLRHGDMGRWFTSFRLYVTKYTERLQAPFHVGRGECSVPDRNLHVLRLAKLRLLLGFLARSPHPLPTLSA